jgi:hypothetical protein
MATSSLGPCPDCGHLVSALTAACPDCGRVLRPSQQREGLFLRILNQAVAAGFWLLLLLIGVPLLAAVVGFLMTR